MKINKYKTLQLLIFFIVLSGAVWAYAEEGQPPVIEPPKTDEHDLGGMEPSGEHFYHYPEIPPQYSLWAGYHLVTLKGSERAAEFESIRDTISFGGSLIAFPFPFRAHLEFDYLASDDYFGDVRLAYKDNVQIRALGRKFVHNLRPIEYPSIDTDISQPDILSGEKYRLETGIYNAYLRGKLSNYPLHLYLEYNEVDKKGDIQARFYNFAAKVTEKMPVDWKTSDFKIGINSHLGPVEVDFSHTEKRFDPGSDNFLLDPVLGLHHLTPEFEGSSNELKLHTSYTGRIVASATLMTDNRENETSSAEADYFIGSGHIRYIATQDLVLVLKYKHKDLDLDNPSSLTELVGQPVTPLLPIRSSISSTTDTVTGIATYRIASNLTLGADASYKKIDREDAEAWHLPETTKETLLGLNATYRPLKTLKVRAKFTHTEMDDPAWTFQPDTGNSGSVSLSWVPVPAITGFITYELAKEDREEFPLFGLISDVTGNDRDVLRDKFTSAVTFVVNDQISVTPSFAYWHNRVKQDLKYASSIFLPATEILDEQVRYTDTARNYALAVNYMPEEKLNLGAEVSHTRAHGNFYPNTPDALNPVSIAEFSKLEINETIYSLSARYEVLKYTELGLDYSYTDFNTEENPLNPEDEDGIAHVILVSVTKRWF